jgi:hypothetical protein
MIFYFIAGIPAASISISPLGSQSSQGVILFIIYLFIFLFKLDINTIKYLSFE